MYIEFEGRLIKSGSWYAAEVPALLVHTQGKSQKKAIQMVNDAIEELLMDVGVKDFEPKLTSWTDRTNLEFSVLLPFSKQSIVFILRQLRGHKEMSLADVANEMGLSSKNSIAAYEKYGKDGREPTIGKLADFFKVYEIDAQIRLKA